MAHIAYGLDGVAITETRLSKVEGEAGELWLGGFPVEDLAPRARFEEVLFLLLHDRLPSAAELADLETRLASRRELAPATLALLRDAAAAGVTPMDALRMGVATLPLLAPHLGATDLHTERSAANEERALRLVAGVPTVVAAYARLCAGLEPVAPDPSLDHVSAYLYGVRGERPEPGAVRALSTYLNTTADHGMNASTFAARVVASTRSDMVAAVVAALGALKGPLHGGAPGPALDMVTGLVAQAERSGGALSEVAEAWVADRVDAGERIMGFGHRILPGA